MKVILAEFRRLSWDNVRFLWKSQFGVRRCTTAYGKFYVCKCSLDLSIPYRKNIQSPAVTRCRIPGIFCQQIQNWRDWPHTWWLAKLLLSYRFLKSGNNIIAIFTKSTYSVPASTELCLIEVKPRLALQRTKKWEVERRMSEGSDKGFHVYRTNPAL